MTLPNLPDTTLLLKAAGFAAFQHRSQRRKDVEATPYINHPLELARVLATVGGVTDVATLCAALLHDTVEDTGTTLDDLTREFGPEIAGLVAELTDDKSLGKDERKRLQVEHAPHLSAKARRVKLADKTCNLRDVAASPPAGWPLERQRAYFDWAKSVIDGLRDQVDPTDRPLVAAFDEAYAARP